VQTTTTTSPTGADRCADDALEAPVAAPAGGAGEDTEAEARRRWLATSAWPEVAFATA
jgi:hypothetical protein